MHKRMTAVARGIVSPSVKLEVALAILLTFFAVLLMVRHVGSAAAIPVKTSMQAPPLPTATAPAEASVQEFMEKFALSRVAPPLPEPALETAGQQVTPALVPSAAVAALAARTSAARDNSARKQPTAKTSVPTPPRAAVEARPGPAAMPQQAQAQPAKPTPGRFPIISTITEKIPSGRDIANGFTSLGRKIGSIFSRG